MSSTFSSSSREQLGVGVGARDERVQLVDRDASSPTLAAAIATICWASTSSGLRGTTVGSISPSRMRRATTAHSSRSARNFGKIRPSAGLADAVARAADALQAARDRLRRLDLHHEVDGAHVDAELERARSRPGTAARPALSSSSTVVRSSRASEPWWARAISAGASSPVARPRAR